jgi:hypothetical protein
MVRDCTFGIAPPPVLNDTTLLPEEIVSVEVWSWTENRLYTQQEVLMDAEKKRSYTIAWYPGKNRFVQLSSPEMPEVRFQEQRDAGLAAGFTEEPYAKLISWEGVAHKDIYAIDQNTGDKTLVIKDVRCNPRVSPSGRYIYLVERYGYGVVCLELICRYAEKTHRQPDGAIL